IMIAAIGPSGPSTSTVSILAIAFAAMSHLLPLTQKLTWRGRCKYVMPREPVMRPRSSSATGYAAASVFGGVANHYDFFFANAGTDIIKEYIERGSPSFRVVDDDRPSPSPDSEQSGTEPKGIAVQ